MKYISSNYIFFVCFVVKYITHVNNIYGENMERKFVSEGRYKKVPRSATRKRRVKKSSVHTSKKNIQKKKISNKKKYKVKTDKFVRFLFCSILLVVIAIVARLVTMNENESFIPVFNNNEIKENTDSINIAIYDNTSIGTNNLVVSELEKYIYPMLIRIGKDYAIKYELLSGVNKINNKEYELVLNEVSAVTAVDVKDSIDKIIHDKSKYYYKVENVDDVEVKSSNIVKINLKSDDEYFIYNLDFPIYKVDDNFGIYSVNSISGESQLVLNRKNNVNKEYIKEIKVIKVASEEEAIEMYKQEKIDVFFASSKNCIKMLGKYEYDIKSYNSGEGIYLMFNPLSDMTKEKYIRQIVAYSVDREGILSGVLDGQGQVIDLPYIFDEQKYKYDVYAADNILLSNGYKKQNLYYTKSGRKLTLELLVNKQDEEKVSIANKIKNDLLKVGVNINISALNEKELEKRKNAGSYDMILASIYVNESPSISYVYNSIPLSEEINNNITQISNDNLDNISDNIKKLKTAISDNISIYGIYSKDNYVIYKKGLSLFKNINYMNLFSDYFNY